MSASSTVTARGRTLSMGPQTQIMGIVNITPDSFSRDGCVTEGRDYHNRAWRHALRQIRDGSDILDIGGESTRPGASRVDSREELSRILPTVKRLAKHTDIPISIDTNKSVVARAALDCGAHIINNIKGVKPNISLLKMIARYDAAVVLMHMPPTGTPRTMQKHICDQDVVSGIFSALQESIEKCLEIGIKSDRIIIDPGFGFGKTPEQNLIIMNRLASFRKLDKPILIGTSRKSFIGHVLNSGVHERLMGTAATVAIGIQNGARIVRVHDVKAMKDVARVSDCIRNEKA